MNVYGAKDFIKSDILFKKIDQKCCHLKRELEFFNVYLGKTLAYCEFCKTQLILRTYE
jgi:hypothetical protein